MEKMNSLRNLSWPVISLLSVKITYAELM